MNLLRFWRKRPRYQQKTILLSVFVFTVFSVAGFFISEQITKKELKKDYITVDKNETDQALNIFQSEYKKINFKPKELFWLGNLPSKDAFVKSNQVFYINKSDSLTPEAISKAATLTTNKESQRSIKLILQAYRPLKKVGPNQYQNSDRQVFIWVVKKGNSLYLVTSKNIKTNPGDVK